MILARMLTPTDFGIYAMVMSVVGLLFMFRDGGVESALINRDSVTSEELAALNSFNALWGLTLTVGIVALGPMLAWLYQEPRLIAASAVASVSFLIYGFDVQPAALLLRAQRFATHAFIEFFALLFALGVAVGFAITTGSYWALFALDIALAAALLSGHIKAARWRITFAHPWRTVRGMLSFGRTLSIVRLLGHGSRNIDQIIVGLTLGPASLALYSKAIRLVNLPHEAINWPLSRVAIPALSRLREDHAKFRETFGRLNGISATLALPIVIWIAVSADVIVATLYGDQWNAMVPIVQILAILGAFNTVMTATTWVYVSTGKIERQIGWESFTLVIIAIALGLGVRSGINGAAIACVAAGVVLRICAWFYSFHQTPVGVQDLLAVLWQPATAGIAAGVTVIYLRSLNFVSFNSAPVEAFMMGLATVAVYAVTWMILPQGKLTLLALWREAKSEISPP